MDFFSLKIFEEYCAEEWLPVIDLAKSVSSYPAKSYIFREGDPVEGIYFIEKGKVKVTSRVSKNEEKIVRIAGDGMVLGHRGLHNQYFTISACAITSTTVTLIPKQLFIKILKSNPDLSMYLLQFLCDELLDAEERVKNLTHFNPKKRIASVLVKLIDQFGYDKEVKSKLIFSINRSDLANMAGTTYETVIRTLSVFESEKTIKLSGKDYLILKEKKLRSLATEFES